MTVAYAIFMRTRYRSFILVCTVVLVPVNVSCSVLPSRCNNHDKIIHTDASCFAVAAALDQLDDEGKERPIAFASQKLTGSQFGWVIIEKEANAIIWALNRFRNILYGAHITIFCDHNPLQYIRECVPKSAKLLHWALALQEFEVNVKYTKGSQNVVADFLSRV